jgi:hypothetical protein
MIKTVKKVTVNITIGEQKEKIDEKILNPARAWKNKKI